MKLIPLYHQVIIEKDLDEKKSNGGILLTGTAASKDINKGIIIAVGEGRLLPDGSLRPLGIKEGDRVIFSRYSEANKILNDGRTYIVATDSDIICKIQE